MLDQRIYGMALEMHEPVSEIASTGQGLKRILSNDARAANKCIREARRLKRSGDTRAAHKKYDEATKLYKKVRRDALKIKDDTVLDFFISGILKTPWQLSIFKFANSLANEGKIGGETRTSTVAVIDAILRNIDQEKINSY